MITPSTEYLEVLYQIQDKNQPNRIIHVPANKPIYEIDLNSRMVATPEVLSVEYDHNSKSIFFSVDRFFDNIDLSEMSCVIQYQNANPDKKKNGYIYGVPFYDLITFKDEGKILFQWDVEGPATAYKGVVTFSIKFYRISNHEIIDDETGQNTAIKVYDYVLNTLPSKTKVLEGMNIYEASNNYFLEAEVIEVIYDRLRKAEATSKNVYWIVLDDSNPIIRPPDYPPNTIDKNDNIINNII